MVTAEEIGSVAIFGGLSDADRERLARAAADITLAPGEYAAHEGAEPGVFPCSTVRSRPFKRFDGIRASSANASAAPTRLSVPRPQEPAPAGERSS